MKEEYPQLTVGSETRNSLHAYCRALGAIKEHLTPPHPRWWHGALSVTADGFSTGELGGAEGRHLPALGLDLHRHSLTAGERELLNLASGPSSKEVGECALAFLASHGPEVEPARERWDDPAGQMYDAETAGAYRRAFHRVATEFAEFRSGLAGSVSPVHLWPHHFDLSMEWLGSRRVQWEEGGEEREAAAQIGFGFSAGDSGHPEPYFYANPWPFEAGFSETELPAGAGWHLEEWQGALLPYAAVASGTATVHSFLESVFELASPAFNQG